MKKLITAFWKSPGPKNIKEGFHLSLKGFLMGTADIIPGVSGGTIALITGIYEDLLNSIKSYNIQRIKELCSLQFEQFLIKTNTRFLFFLGSGIILAILSISRLMNFLLNVHPVPTWSLFFGLILSSIWVLGRKIQDKKISHIFSFIIGIISAYWLVGVIPLQTPEELWFIFLCGVLAICAMILPGISGAFILLILGKYEFITSTLKNPFSLDNLLIIIVFCCGALIGITSFTRVLSFFLKKYHYLTLSFLTGLMTGSLRKIWPWKKVIETAHIGHKEFIIKAENIFPGNVSWELIIAIFCMIFGALFVILLEKLANNNENKD